MEKFLNRHISKIQNFEKSLELLLMQPLEPDSFYHIYNRANGSEILFTNQRNYLYFIKQYQYFISPIAKTFCYCLMPNHFHFLVRIKDEKQLVALPAFPKFQTLEKFLSKQFSNLFSSYTQAFNKQQNRKGSLFMKNFKRKQIKDEKYLRKIVHYIHYNPVKADLCPTPLLWTFSSYPAIVSNKQTMIQKEEVIEWFNDMDNFIYCHKQPPIITGIDY